MAIISHMLSEKVISGFRGTLDFYFYMGKPCVRKWPKSPGKNRSPAVQAWWKPFKEATQLAKEVDGALIRYYSVNAVGTKQTWKDLFFTSYMKGLNITGD